LLTALFQTLSLKVNKKLILTFSLIMIATSSASGAMIYRSNQTLFQEEIKNQFFKTNEQTLARISQSISEVERTSQSIVFQPTVVSILTLSSPTEKVKEMHQLYEVVSQAKLDTPNIRAMFIYNLSGESYYNANYGAISELTDEVRKQIDEELRDTNGAMVWLRMNLDSTVDPEGYRTMIVAARTMKSPYQQTYGTLVLVLDEGFFSAVTSELEGENGRVYLLDRKDRLLYTHPRLANEGDIPLQHGEESETIRTTEARNYLFVKKSAPSGQFKLVSGLSLNEMDKRNADVFKMIALSGIATTVLAALLLFIASARMLRPLKELVSSMRKVRAGQMDTRIVVESKDELAFLGETFNTMIEHIHTLVNVVMIKRLREKEAELRTLQAQLNPHFLYNILNEIYWKLYLQNVKDTAGIIKSLSTILQYSLKPIEFPSTLEEELAHIKSYIAIQMELFHPDLELELEAEEQVLTCDIQRLILQPTIENVFVHAFSRKVHPDRKRLAIRAYREGETLRIDITDNGKGIEPEMLHRLRMIVTDSTSEHLGVLNVKRRIELVHGAPYDLRFESRIDVGTTVSYILPMGKEETA